MEATNRPGHPGTVSGTAVAFLFSASKRSTTACEIGSKLDRRNLTNQAGRDGAGRGGAGRGGVRCRAMPVHLSDDVSAFVDDVASILAELSGRSPTEHLPEAVIEAADILAAIIDADGRFADAELRAYLDALGTRLDPPLLITPQRLREGRSLEDRKRWLRQPSVLFDLLLRADARGNQRRSHRYYELALRLAHVIAAIDLVPSPEELTAIDGFRTMMLQAMDNAQVTRPGRAEPSRITSNRPEQPTTAATSASQPADVHVVLPPARSITELLAELDALIGLDNVKAEVRRLSSLLQVQQLRSERGLPTIETSHHLVFSGNPGTGKTTVARLLSQIYRAVGVVSKGQLVETDRADLVAGFVGQTALKTQHLLEAAIGGMLLIDEAYALSRGGENDFGLEAIDTLVKFMEDHRDDLAIVAAGYVAEMADFIDANPGLKSRFTRTINFPDYTTDELVSIFLGLGERTCYVCSDDAAAKVRRMIEAEPRTHGFGNARFIRNLFETAVAHQAMRVVSLTDPSNEELTTLVADDIAAVDN